MSYVQLSQPLNLTAWVAIWPQLEQLLDKQNLPNLVRLVNDSRQVQQGDTFFALAGIERQGQDFIQAALAQGASLVVTEGELALQKLDNAWFLTLPHLAERLGALLALSRKAASEVLLTQAVTGTNGKSSVAHYLCQAWQLLQQRCALVGTLGKGELQQLQVATHTTPDVFELHQLYKEFAQAGVGRVAVEASSHALDQGRLDGLQLDSVIFTNLSRDHLDYHGSFAAYAAAKQQLFLRPEVRKLIFNLDDSYGAAWLDEAWQALHIQVQQQPQARQAQLPQQLFAYSLKPVPVEQQLAGVHYVTVQQASYTLAGIQATVLYQDQAFEVLLPLLGEFNLANCLAVIAALLAEGISLEQLVPVMAQLQPVPGRMQRICLPKAVGQPQVVVDFAHSPDALSQVLAALKSHCKGQIWCVFGCGGNRDAGKRQLMGAAAEAGADRVLVTDDNPRFENPTAIRQEVLLGAGLGAQEIASRKQAIFTAIQQAEPEDWVLIAGKGHETWQEFAGKKLPFSDSQTAEQALLERLTSQLNLAPRQQEASL